MSSTNTSRTTVVFYSLIAVAALFLMAQVLLQPVRQLVLKQFHLKHNHFTTFALVHFIPPMYSFTNEVWYSHNLMDFQALDKGDYRPGEAIQFWFNHYPLRVVTFSSIPRPTFHNQTKPQYLYVRSRYLDQVEQNIYRLKKDGEILEIIPQIKGEYHVR